ncbi:MAG TPA: pilus assembly protein [Chloroflexia bacterium]|nr:pilus assembly protein [Chloroflexia bacterium]
MRKLRLLAQEKQQAQGLVEYGLILVLVMVVVVVVVALTGNQINNLFSTVTSEVQRLIP